ncbi:MAG: hypothetical protein QF570_11500 [Myxococcota bacterium]|nr:hypothetical protein [Myxococcota bacterium]
MHFDRDRNAATGCTVASADGPIPGIELRLRTTVDLMTEEVVSITHASCVDGAFGAENPVSSGATPPWDVVTGGGIMLMHDIHPNTVAELPAVISAMRAAGATFVHLDDLILFPILNGNVNPPEPPACCDGTVN